MSDVPVKEYLKGITGEVMCACSICGKEFIGLKDDETCPRKACVRADELSRAIMLHAVNCEQPTDNDIQLWEVVKCS